MDSNLAPYMTELAVSWGLNAAGILFVIPVILLRVTDRESLPFAAMRHPVSSMLNSLPPADTAEAVVKADDAPRVVADSALEKEGSLDEKKGYVV